MVVGDEQSSPAALNTEQVLACGCVQHPNGMSRNDAAPTPAVGQNEHPRNHVRDPYQSILGQNHCARVRDAVVT
jgi:hypothetical protein